MCTVCGCGQPGANGHSHEHAHDHSHDHDHSGHHHHHGEGTIDYGGGLAGVHAPGLSQERIVRIERDILSKNDAYAAENRARLKANGNFALNFVSSPGSGKTTLLARTIADMAGKLSIQVIEGDQQTANDAERIRSAGARAVQINTGKGCHLDAHMVGHALGELAPPKGAVIFIENVGNLVCPSAFDLGEAHKVVVLSVTEGEDKPLKYPDMFAAADLMLINKADLAPHCDFDLDTCKANALRINPRLMILTVSARTGDGLAAFYGWLEAGAAVAAAA